MNRFLSGNLIKQEEGLPNITGDITSTRFGSSIGWDSLSPSKSGCFNNSYWYYGAASSDSNNNSKSTNINFNASLSNSIYGKSDHVTPVNFTIRIWNRIS